MKRILLLFLTVPLLLQKDAAFTGPPESENVFYELNCGTCRQQPYRVYVSEQERLVYDAPYGMKQSELPEGSRIGIEWLYTERDGTVWGYTDGEKRPGWICMNGLKLVYDRHSFSEEHASALMQNDFGLAFSDWMIEYRAALYEYPLGTFLTSRPGYLERDGVPQLLFWDRDGRLWGSVADGSDPAAEWICLDDPWNEMLGTNGEILLQTAFLAADDGEFTVNLIFRSIGTFVAVLATAVFMGFVLWKRKGERNNGNEMVGTGGLYDGCGN